MSKLIELDLTRQIEMLRTRQISSRELTESYLAQIESTDGEIGAFLTVCAQQALESADGIDNKRAKGENLAPLAGVPYALKDNICTKGIATTCASKMLENFVPPYSAHTYELLQKQGAVLLGKLNCDEFAMGGSTENSAFKPTRNPADLTRVPGGSSGGSAAAVAARQAAFTLGSDTGGSIRQPASFCGVVGIKPTYGAVSRFGLVAFASSLDQIGPLTTTVRGSAKVLSAIAGFDPRDTTSIQTVETNYCQSLDEGVRGLKIAVPKEFFGSGIHPETAEIVKNAALAYEKLGAQIVECTMPNLKFALPAYYVLSSAEASSNLARFDGVKYGFRAQGFSDIDTLYKSTRTQGFGTEVKRRIALGSFVLSAGYYDAYYKKALQVRTVILNEFKDILSKADCILGPVAPTAAYKIGEKTGDPLEMYMGDIFTVPVNIAGLPAISLPAGKTAEGLPVGMQLIGKALDEKTLYRVANAYEFKF